MAATDLVYNTVDPVLFTPDYSFLRYTLDKAQSRYDQGLDAVSKAYNNLKQELTDPVNQQRRDQFLKDAQTQLQKIASSDLSLPQNIAAANNVFDPLATNPAFITDAYHTKRLNEQNAIMNEWANSNDEAIRKQYKPELQRWLNRDREILRNGKGDVNNYKNLQNRQALAYLDPQDILAKAAKDYGYQFKYDQLGQPYIVTTEGGKEGLPSYDAFATNVLKNNQAYQRQVKAIGEARAEDVLDFYKDNPLFQGKGDTEKYYDWAVANKTSIRNSTKTTLDDLQKTFNKEDAEIKAYWNTNQDRLKKGQADIVAGNEGTEDAQLFKNFTTRADTRNQLKEKLINQQSQFDEMFGPNAPTDTEFATAFSKNPKQFFADQEFKDDVQTFKNIRAASTSVKITPDSAYTTLENSNLRAMKQSWDMMDDMQDNFTDQEKIALKEFALNAKGLKTQKNADGTTTVVSKGGADIMVGSASATQLYMIDAFNRLKNDITLAKASAIQNLTGADGALTILTSPGFGMTNEEVGRIKSLYSKQLNSDDPSKAIGLTAEDKKALTHLTTALAPYAKNAGFDFTENGIKNITVKDVPLLLQKGLAGYKPQNQNEVGYMLNMNKHGENYRVMNEKMEALGIGRKAVVNKFANDSHPEFKGMFVNRGTDAAPDWDIINEKDLDNKLKPFIEDKTIRDEIVSKYFKQDPSLVITNKTLAQSLETAREEASGLDKLLVTIGMGYANYNGLGSNKQSPEYGTTIFLNNKKYDFKGLDLIPTKKYNELVKKINSEVAIPDYMNEKGEMLANPRFLVKGDTAAKIGQDLSDATQTNANIFEYKEGTSEPTQVTENQVDIRNKLTDAKNIAGVTVYSASSFNNGGPAIEVKMTDSKSDKKQFWEGKTYFFPINLNSTTPQIISDFAQAKEVGVFEKFKKEGKDYVFDLFQGMGIKYIVHPNMSEDNSGTVEVLLKPWDPTTKTYGTWEHIDPMNPLTTFDLSQVTFPEITQNLNQNVVMPYINNYIVNQKTKAQSMGISTKPITLESILK